MVATAENSLNCTDFDGGCIVTVWKKKSVNELDKIRG